MKKYFAKYLPVDRNIKVGDWIKYRDPSYGHEIEFLHKVKSATFEGHTGPADDDIIVSETGKKDILYRDCTPVELFLCSRDIQVGDSIECYIPVGEPPYYTDKGLVTEYKPEDDTITYVVDNDPNHQLINVGRDFCYKVIGPISPQALWVKEGMEFDEDEIYRFGYLRGKEEKWSLDIIQWDGWVDAPFVKIKGPCGHFH
jgi:hypothetical protein